MNHANRMQGAAEGATVCRSAPPIGVRPRLLKQERPGKKSEDL
jgi:hypothetical protein